MTLWTYDQFVTHEFQRPSYIIDPVFPHKGVLCIHGQQTSGKSQLALGMLVNLVRGEMFLKQYRTTQGSVAYVQYDLPEKLWQDRLGMLKPILSGMPFYNVVDFGYHNMAEWKKGGKWFLPSDVAQLREIQPETIVVDSVARCHQMDENDSRATRLVYGYWQELFPDSSLAFIHHNNKDKVGPFRQNEASRPRGSTAWLDNANGGMGIRRLGRGKGGKHRAQIVFTKVTAGEEPSPCEIEISTETLLLTPTHLTARELAELFIRDNPRATKKQLVDWLTTPQENGDKRSEAACGPSRAYQIATEMAIT